MLAKISFLFLVGCASLMIGYCGSAQTSTNHILDSLQQEIKTTVDVVKVNKLYLNLYLQQMKIDRADAKSTLEKRLQFNKSNNHTYYVAETYLAFVAYYNSQANWDSTTYYLEKAKDYINVDEDPFHGAMYYTYGGVIASHRGDYDKAISSSMKADEIIESHLNENKYQQIVFNNFNNLGLTHNHLAFLTTDSTKTSFYKEKKTHLVKSLSFFNKALAIAKKNNNQYAISISLQNIGGTYLDLGQLDSALLYNKLALELNVKENNKEGELSCIVMLAQILGKLHRREDAMEYLRKAILLNDAYGSPLQLANCYLNIADVYRHVEPVNNDSAEYYMLQALLIANEKNYLDKKEIVYRDLSAISEERKNFEKAYKYFKMWYSLRDSIYGSKTENQIRELDTKYETVQKEKQIVEQNIAIQAKALQNIELQKQIQLNALKSAYERKQAIAKTEKEKQELRYEESLKRQLIEADYATQQASLVASQRQKDLVSTNIQKQLQLSRLQLRQQWFYGIAALMTLIAGGIWYYLYSRNRRLRLQSQLLQERAAQQLKELEYKNRMNEVSFSALRSQMNPHFIFNCLNSIKLYTEQNNSEAASAYLSKFAGLIRSTLDNARAEKIVLADEIKNLDLYLQMESMRFKEKLQYNIMVDDDVDTEFIEIPPMLLQPYVENAIWHGLMQRKEGGILDIHFTQSDENDFLSISILDNGIGRARAALLKTKPVDQHKSYGTQITTERIALINDKYGAVAQVKIHDLKNEANESCGTLVTIKLPIK